MNSSVATVMVFIASAPVLTIVLPAERDAAIVTSDEPRVCDRDPMGVAGQIGENLLRSCEGALGVDDPLTLTQRHEPVGEGIGISQIEVLAEELQLTIKMEVHKLFKEAAPEKTRQHPDREEEPRLARHPAVGIRCEAAAGHDAMHVRMMRQGRAPGVQHQVRADPGTQVLRIGGDRAQRLGGDVEQKSINDLLVGIGDGADRRWQGEHHVVIRHGQEVRLSFFEPALCGAALALRTVPVTARVVGDLRFGARRTAQRMAAEREAAALLNRRHDLQLAEAEVPAPVLSPSLPVGAEDIRDLQGIAWHEPVLRRSGTLQGLKTLRNVSVATWV